jgi:hypothetical protein
MRVVARGQRVLDQSGLGRRVYVAKRKGASGPHVAMAGVVGGLRPLGVGSLHRNGCRHAG